MFAADPLSPIICKVRPPWIRLLCPARPTDDQFDWDLVNLEAKSTPQTHCCAPHKPFKAHYLAERGHNHQGIPFPWKGVCNNAYVDGTCQSNIHMEGRTQGSQQNIAQSITLPSTDCLLSIVRLGARCSPGKRCRSTQPSWWCDAKHDSSGQPPPSIAPWSSSDAQVLIAGAIWV